ncbi:MAG: hypothetical protein KKI08_12555, partial [Armatimonadetes bacterium]|nr:hypothetical protein [Armatimonadota bacterium]
MITRIYIDNYKCFSNFEYKPGQNQLVLGRNGVGKSTLFDIVAALKALLTRNVALPDLLTAASRTRWDRREAQTFELDIEGNGGVYRYSLVVDHEPETARCRVDAEE